MHAYEVLGTTMWYEYLLLHTSATRWVTLRGHGREKGVASPGLPMTPERRRRCYWWTAWWRGKETTTSFKALRYEYASRVWSGVGYKVVGASLEVFRSGTEYLSARFNLPGPGV